MAPLQRSTSAVQSDQLQIQHFTHPHLLHKLYMTFEFNCDGCNTGGYGVRYRCSACDFDLHEQCATSPNRISSHLHPQHQLIIVNRPGDSHVCHVCRGFTNGLSYTCESQTCEFDVHPVCIKVTVATGVPSLTLDQSQIPGATTSFGGYNGGSNNSQPMMVNKQQKQGIPATTSFGGYQGGNNSQPVMGMANHQHQQQQGIPTTSFNGYNGVNIGQPMMVNNQQQQGIPTTSFNGYNGVNIGQPMMVNHQQQQGMSTTSFGGYQGLNNNQPMMVNQQQQQKQGMPTTSFGGYNGVNNSQPMMVNHQQQQQQGIPTTAFNGYNGMNPNQQLMINHHQQRQQQQGMPTTAFGGYNGMNNNQQQQQQPVKSNNYAKVGKFAANILTTSLIGVPIFNPRR